MLSLLTLLLNIVIIGAIIYVIFWAMGYLGFPEPIVKVITVILVIVFLIYFIGAVQGGFPYMFPLRQLR